MFKKSVSESLEGSQSVSNIKNQEIKKYDISEQLWQKSESCGPSGLLAHELNFALFTWFFDLYISLLFGTLGYIVISVINRILLMEYEQSLSVCRVIFPWPSTVLYLLREQNVDP